ncbi:DUF58 domain-containing protein [bacterium]|nr:DUF58 domain-containing protein [bacterium]
MTSDLPPSLDPEIVRRVESLEVRSRSIVEGLLAGRHASPFRGGSADFAQHRPYAAGDDLRYLDWKVWAKSDRLYVREFEEETNLRAMLLVDTSPSMEYGQGDRQKIAYAQQLAGSLAFLLLRQSDSVGLIVPNDSKRNVPLRQGQGHLRTILATLLTGGAGTPRGLEDALVRPLDRMTGRGIVVIVSDLFVDRERFFLGLRSLRERRHDVIVMHVLHPDELDFPFEGTTRFEGMEDDEAILCDARGLRDGYRQSMQSFLTEIRQRCGSLRVDYRLCRTGEGADVALASLLRERMRS